MHGEYKTPGGKLVVVDVEVAEGKLTQVEVSGDFFLYPEEALGDITRALEGMDAALDAEGIAAGVRVELRPGAEVKGGATPVRMPSGDHLAELPGDLAVEVRHRGDLLGAITTSMPANDPMDPTKERLVRDLAAQAGLVLTNVRLIEDLRASRERIVAAQDQERRRIERNIHDGAQQELVALAIKQRLVEGLVDRDPGKAKNLLSQLQADTTAALENLRDLARGIYPPLLSDQGLAAALEAQARKAAIPIATEAVGTRRYRQEMEAAVYFCCLEAIQNATKHADASKASIRLWEEDGDLRFSVADDGRGFDMESAPLGTGLQNMADRLAALEGVLEVHSRSGQGTTVSGRVPVRSVA